VRGNKVDGRTGTGFYERKVHPGKVVTVREQHRGGRSRRGNKYFYPGASGSWRSTEKKTPQLEENRAEPNPLRRELDPERRSREGEGGISWKTSIIPRG